MGIEIGIASVIAREHAWRAIRGDVVLLGRQTMFFAPAEAERMIREAGLEVPRVQYEADAATRQASSAYVSDRDFFRLLGVPRISALDVSDYEGAEIIHDLTQPLPAALEASADFILDGSTLDNVFNPAMAICNIARLLRPGGRLVATNVATNCYGPYSILTAHWFVDYFAVNEFADCKVYLRVYGDRGVNVFTPDLERLQRDRPQPQNFTCRQDAAIVVVAEKGQRSSWDRLPVQHQYRGDWTAFERGLELIRSSARPDLSRSTTAQFLDGGPDYFFLDQDGRRAKTAPLRGVISRARGKLSRLVAGHP